LGSLDLWELLFQVAVHIKAALLYFEIDEAAYADHSGGSRNVSSMVSQVLAVCLLLMPVYADARSSETAVGDEV
jgi:hypothetical protein